MAVPCRSSGSIVDCSNLKTRGFGFIAPDTGGANVFFHVSGSDNKCKDLVEGQTVTYILGTNKRGPCATGVICCEGCATGKEPDTNSLKSQQNKKQRVRDTRTESGDVGCQGSSSKEEQKSSSNDGFDPNRDTWLKDVLAIGLGQGICDVAKSDNSKRLVREFNAAKTLNAENDVTKHMKAAKQFAASQLERQRAGLETNTRKQPNTDVVATVVSAHEEALKKMLSYTDLTVDNLCQVHAILCAGQGLEEIGKLRSVNVKAGIHKFCEPALVLERLKACVGTANRLANSDDWLPCAEAAAGLVLQCLLQIHPFRDGNGRLARIVCNWMLQALSA